MSDSPQPYRVLARKYRPRSFAELIGQDAMVRTLANAIQRDRLAHAFLMTGVRGVGKTSTARLIAKALNCVGPDGAGGPTIDPCGVCEPCLAIAEGRHIDVIEMDAASNNSIDNVREIIEAVRYAAVSARFKMYIVDEAHMLSKAAWNGFLKTLEEPPAHVKFLFATTEVEKVPVTVLSRCQRFDLRRIPAAKLQAHFAEVAEKEGVRADPAALALIAQAAEGSARDGLSLLDRAIAYAEEGDDGAGDVLVAADAVREMLGLSDRTAILRLLAALLAGDPAPMLDQVREKHSLGVDPLAMVRGLMELVHAVTLDKVGRGVDDPSRSSEEKAAIAEWAGALGHGELHRLWQLLVKAHGEVANAAMPIETCEMALLRCLHAASLPDPGEIARLLGGGGGTGAGMGTSPAGNAGANGAAPSANAVPSADGEASTPAEEARAAPSSEATRVDGQFAPSFRSGDGDALTASAGEAAVPGPAAVPVAAPAEPTAPLPSAEPSMSTEPAGGPLPGSFLELVEVVERQSGTLGFKLREEMGLVRFAPPDLVLKALRPQSSDFARQVAERLYAATDVRWQVSLGGGEAEPSLREQELAREAAERAEILAAPMVKAALAAFPQAELMTDDSPEQWNAST